MNLKQVSPSAIALVVVALIVLAVGTNTENGGFQLAGALVLVVGILLALNQAQE